MDIRSRVGDDCWAGGDRVWGDIACPYNLASLEGLSVVRIESAESSHCSEELRHQVRVAATGTDRGKQIQ